MPAVRSVDDRRSTAGAAVGCRIGYLNPWRDAAENQAFSSLAIAAARVGHELIHLTNSDEIIEARVDFVLAVHPNQPKTTDVPTFGVLHSPRELLLEHAHYGHSLLTYDGYLAIADSLRRFLTAFAAAAGKPTAIGFYYNTPQREFLTCKLDRLIAEGGLRLCHFGTNWDGRLRPVFRALARRPYMRFYGPAKAWDYLNGTAYFGAVPFDGRAVQKVYAAFGAGLASLSRHHALDDVISNRIFEIASVGAAAICPDIPWVRRHFGDSVFYYDPLATTASVVEQIDRAFGEIAADPTGAIERAVAARRIFESEFTAEVMLQNAVAYYEDWRRDAARPKPVVAAPAIDVIVRVGESPSATLLRAVRSIENQTEGRFRVIFVRCRPIELSAITGSDWTRIAGFDVVERLGASRAAALTCGLKAVRSPLFAILDEHDFWLSGHIAALTALVRQSEPGRAFAYSGYLTVEEAPSGEPTTARERRHIGNMSPATGDLESIGRTFAICCFLASSDLLRLVEPDEDQATEDWVLQASLMSRADPLFSYRATACTTRDGRETVEGAAALARRERDLERSLRLQTAGERLERKMPGQFVSGWAQLGAALRRLNAEKSTTRLGQATVLVLREAEPGASIHDDADLERKEIPLTPERVSLAGRSHLVRHEGEPALAALPDEQPWVYAATVRLDPADLFSGAQSVVLEFAPVADAIGAGLLNKAATDFQTRIEIPVSTLPVEAWLDIEDRDDVSAIVIHNGAQPAMSEICLRKVWVAGGQSADSDAMTAVSGSSRRG